jgi:arylsulfatase A-like enzyme
MPRFPTIASYLLLATIPLAPGCSNEVSAGDDSPSSHPLPTALNLTRRGAPPTEVRLVHRLAVPEKLQPWAVLEGKGRVGPLPEGTIPGDPHGVMLTGKGKKTLAIPGAIPTHSCNQVVVELVSQTAVSADLSFYRNGKWRKAHSASLAGGSAEVRRLIFQPGGRNLTAEESPGIRVEIASSGPCFVTAVSFWRVPLEECLPDTSKAPTRIAIAGDSRKAFVLSSGGYLQADFAVTDGAMLQLAYGLLPEFRVQGDRPGMKVRIESGKGTRTLHDLEFTQPDSTSIWNAVTIPLDEHAGQRARLRIEIASVGERAQVAGITEPLLVQPWRNAPSVLLVTADSHRPDFINCYSPARRARTPNLDRLAERGVLFTRFYASTDASAASYTALLSGRSPAEVAPTSTEAETLAEVFAARGWCTVAALSSPELAPADTGLDRGFDRILLPPDRPSRARRAVLWMRSQIDGLEGRPLFAWLHLSDPALPYDPPPPSRNRFINSTFRRSSEELPTPEYPILPLADDPPGRQMKRYLTALYMAEIDSLDLEVGRLLRDPRVARAVVAYTADHGISLGAHGVWWSSAGLYPETQRIPLILAWPGARPGSRASRPVSHLDLGQTLLRLAGLEQTAFPGEDFLLPAGAGDREQPPRVALSAGRRNASITDEKWHLILHLEPEELPECERTPERHAAELYDIEEDPRCETDLATKMVEQVARLRALLSDRLPPRLLDESCGCPRCTPFRSGEGITSRR